MVYISVAKRWTILVICGTQNHIFRGPNSETEMVTVTISMYVRVKADRGPTSTNHVQMRKPEMYM
jgi:hypothetical protein